MKLLERLISKMNEEHTDIIEIDVNHQTAYKKTVTTFVTTIIIFCMTITNFTIGVKYYQLLKAIEVEFAGLLIMFVLLFFWKALRTVPERIYEEQQEIINFQQENIESLIESLEE